MVVIIEDQMHAEWQERFSSVEDAFEELRRRSLIPWNQEPNRCPCTSWESCHRGYEIIEFDDSKEPWRELRRLGTLEVSSKGAVWLADFLGGTIKS